MVEVLHQKGANGLVAEYQCAVTLHARLTASGVSCRTSRGELQRARDAAVDRVANELSHRQIVRAKNQGDALASYIHAALVEDPYRLGVRLPDIRTLEVSVIPIGHNTNSGSSADLLLEFHGVSEAPDLAISLKAYRNTISSLGSKSARASLSRLFLGQDRVTDAEFEAFFGLPGKKFLAALKDFRDVAREFYASSEGAAFVDAYERRKGTRVVNNPHRRKELGDFYLSQRGFKSEHVFAELYVEMFQHGMSQLNEQEISGINWQQFHIGMQFVLGMDKDVLTLNAIAAEDGVVQKVENSFLSGVYSDVRQVLVPGCQFVLTHRPGSSIIGVKVEHGGKSVKCLNLAIWKDATIQYKLDTRVVGA